MASKTQYYLLLLFFYKIPLNRVFKERSVITTAIESNDEKMRRLTYIFSSSFVLRTLLQVESLKCVRYRSCVNFYHIMKARSVALF